MNTFGGGSSSESESEDDFLHPSADPNADEFADYNPRKRRRTGRDAKESAALGVFGSESEDEGPGRRWKSKTLRGKGMAFVSSGDNLIKDEDGEDEGEHTTARHGGQYLEDAEDVDMDDAADDTAEVPRAGLGAQSAPGLGQRNPGVGGGLGWQSPAARSMGLGNGDSTASPLGRGFMPSSAAIPVLKDFSDEKPVKRVAMPSAFSTPTAAKGGRPGAQKAAPINAGSFAARMMAKMGYKEGEGLGKEGQGRSGVIEVQLRPQGAGLGAVKEKSKQEKEEERRQAAKRGEVLEDSEEEERKRRRRKAKTSGTDSGMSGMSTPKRRPKPKFQSLPELQKAAPGLKIPDAFTPILDMTGSGQKFLTASSGLATPTSGVAESTEVVEARKLARRAQNDLSSFVEEWKNLEERKAWVEMEILQQQQAVDEQNGSSEQLRQAADIVEVLSAAVRDGQWDPVIGALTEVEKLDVAGNDELASIAVAAVHPFFRQAIEGWQPLEDPKLSGVASDGFVSAISGISKLLGMIPEPNGGAQTSKPHNNRVHKTTPYESLIYTVWFPKVRSAITNSWDVQDPTPLLTLLDLWTPLLPPFIKSQIFEHLIFRKLDEAIADWNPKKRSRTNSLPHMWLFPWLQHLPAHHLDPRSSSGLVADVKRKFRVLIDTWDFRRGIIPGLTQWKDLLRPSSSSKDDSWTPLLINHVLPNLAKYLRTNFQVTPQDQEPYMKTLNNVLEWQSILGNRVMGQLLVDELFPMWHDVLHQWLTLDDVNYLEIRDWFDFWRGIIPASLSSVPSVKQEWQKGDNLINAALDLGERAKTDLPAPTRPSRASPAAQPAPEPAPKIEKPELEEVTFRHQLEDWCMARDLQFIPAKSTLEANGPVYRVTAAAIGKGGVLIYVRADSIYAQIKKGTWTPLGKEMDALFELAHR
ncbi:hypothetical protein V493_07199 [Pseudogymnoascus sp. VKM F-4281 (FW-2241)]|nr:hypothetical protein V493_07199 [Pseudogymnoascus sp. VKM F-4281 (FW-2241)]